MRILLIGATGQLGSALLTNNSGDDIVAPARTELDITSADAVASALRAVRPDWVINTAAFHNVPLCEEQPEPAFRINCVAVRALALACRDHDARLVTFSTDYVFGGEQRRPYAEGDRPNPLQVYGISKLAGEQAAMAAAPEHVMVVRTCGLYGLTGAASKGGNFVDKRIADGRRGVSFDMSNDQTVSPTSVEDLGEAVIRLMKYPQASPGLYHLVNEGECTWFELTRAIFEVMGIDTEVRPVDRGGRSGLMARPLYSALANTRARALGVVLPSWRNALERYLQIRYQVNSVLS